MLATILYVIHVILITLCVLTLIGLIMINVMCDEQYIDRFSKCIDGLNISEIHKICLWVFTGFIFPIWTIIDLIKYLIALFKKVKH